MRPEEHNKYLAYAHLGYGAFQLLMTFVMMAFFFFIFSPPGSGNPAEDFPPPFLALVFIFALLFQLLFTLPSFIAGFGLLKGRSWAKTAGLVAGALGTTSFPLGIALCVYTFWFLFGEGGKELYDKPSRGEGSRPISFLHEPSDAYAANAWAQREDKCAPQMKMPDWR